MATYLGTLRPSGDLGDHDDATSESQTDDGAGGALSFSWNALADLAEGTVTFVRFVARVSWDVPQQGPLDPTCGPQWRMGGAGTVASATESVDSNGIHTVASGDISADPDGGAWTLASIATLQMSLAATTNDNGSRVETTVYCHDLWAEVWGTSAGGVQYNVVEATGDGGGVAVTGSGGGSAPASGSV